MSLNIGLALVMASIAVLPGLARAQSSTSSEPLKVGDLAPDFTVATVTIDGATDSPFRLFEHRGETVVLAFFPKARTPGCTVQMESYRDRYSELFRNGAKVTLVGISIDPDTALASWARDARFPFRFGSDADRKVGMAYSANSGIGFHKRFLYVIDPEGRISYVAAPFNQMSAEAYTELGSAIADAASDR